jgi:hypothetical protein
MSLVLQSSGGGQITIQEPATASNFTATLPAATGTLVVTCTTPTLNGITFPATQVPSADANTLDDYEEGTFTPTSAGGITSPTYTRQVGAYTRIGNLVYIQVSISLSGGTRNSGQVIIGNLPFITSSFNGGVGLSVAYVNEQVVNSRTINIPTLYVNPSSIDIGFYDADGGTFIGTELVGANFRIDFSGSYIV